MKSSNAMRASKQTAAQAMKSLKRIRANEGDDSDFTLISTFLSAAKRKLPSNKSYAAKKKSPRAAAAKKRTTTTRRATRRKSPATASV